MRAGATTITEGDAIALDDRIQGLAGGSIITHTVRLSEARG
jgi:hypothetical protein